MVRKIIGSFRATTGGGTAGTFVSASGPFSITANTQGTAALDSSNQRSPQIDYNNSRVLVTADQGSSLTASCIIWRKVD